MKNQKTRLAVLGALGSIAGFAIGVFSEYIGEKKLDIIISEKVHEEFKKQAAKMNNN